MPSEGQTHGRDHHASASSSTPPTPPVQAPPVTPPPLYSLVTPGLHRCSAIGLEEALNEAWANVQSLVSKGKESDRRDASTMGRSEGKRPSQLQHTDAGGPMHTPISPATLPASIIAQSPLLSFLSALRLRTLIYLSPSLLPASLLKLSRDLNLSLLQWDLEGGRVWRVRQDAQKQELEALYAFASVGEQREEGDLIGIDLSSMSKATLEIVLNIHCSGVLVCDPSGLSETSLVIGCLRRMMRWNFASVCLEYRTFAPSRSASTANHLRFIELFPLETLELPGWSDLVPWAARALRLVERDLIDQSAAPTLDQPAATKSDQSVH